MLCIVANDIWSQMPMIINLYTETVKVAAAKSVLIDKNSTKGSSPDPYTPPDPLLSREGVTPSTFPIPWIPQAS